MALRAALEADVLFIFLHTDEKLRHRVEKSCVDHTVKNDSALDLHVKSAQISRSVVSDSATPWTAVCLAPLSMGSSRREHWVGHLQTDRGLWLRL